MWRVRILYIGRKHFSQITNKTVAKKLFLAQMASLHALIFDEAPLKAGTGREQGREQGKGKRINKQMNSRMEK
jgi:hypothetical protein